MFLAPFVIIYFSGSEKRSLDSSASALYDALKVYLYSKTESTL